MGFPLRSRNSRISGGTLFLIGSVLILPTIGSAMLRRFVDQFVYFPMKYPDGDWERQSKAGGEDLWLTAKDGVQLNTWYFPQRKAKYITLFLHGNAGNVTHRVDHAEAVKQAGSAVVVLDYRGYGKSKGRPTERGLYEDADAAYNELTRRGYTSSQIILHGESLGTAVATELASRRKCAALILESPLASLSHMAGQVVPVLGPALAHGFDTKSRIAKIHVPLLILHGDADEVVPFSQGRAVFERANEPKTFWTVSRARHNDLLYVAGGEYVPRLRAFYASLGLR